MTDVAVTGLVLAKAPVPGLAKTRLAATVGPRVAATIAAAALLDTLDAMAAARLSHRVVALTGNLGAAQCAPEIRERLADFTVIEQSGDTFVERLVNAHADTAAIAGGDPVLQIGMDTPQVTDELLTRCAEELAEAPAVLGLAHDGGWWVLGVRSPTMAECLRPVPMSHPDTGELTLRALRDKDIDVVLVDELGDVDIAEDVPEVRRCCPRGGRFVFATAAAGL